MPRRTILTLSGPQFRTAIQEVSDAGGIPKDWKNGDLKLQVVALSIRINKKNGRNINSIARIICWENDDGEKDIELSYDLRIS